MAKTLLAEAKAGFDVVRLVAGDPLSVDSVITEVNAVARSHMEFEIVPGLPGTSAVPSYAGLPLAPRTPSPTCAARWTGPPWPPRPAR